MAKKIQAIQLNCSITIEEMFEAKRDYNRQKCYG